jgi:transcriptional regulator with XRE-family HTH domain
MSQTSENLRYLLWKRGTRHAIWVSWLGERTRLPEERVAALLAGADPEPQELEACAKVLGVPEEDLRFGSLLEDSGTDVMKENLRHLVSEEGRGSKKALAAAMDVHPTTVSRWLSGDQRPPVVARRGLCRYFGLQPDTDLTHVPLFLDPRPLGDRSRREWVRKRMEQISAEDLMALYPALERLLGER